MRTTRLTAALLALLSNACDQDMMAPPAMPRASRGASLRKIPVRRVGGARVFDAKGAAHACSAPAEKCASAPVDLEFLDRCRLRGYFVRKCGCSDFCTGRAPAAVHYDARGAARSCEPERADCVARETSTLFQDACSERGHKLVVCGCEWLCDGPIR